MRSSCPNPSETPWSPFTSCQLLQLLQVQGRGCEQRARPQVSALWCELHSFGRTRDLGEISSQLWCLLFPWTDPPYGAPEHILTLSSQSQAVLLVPGYQGGCSHHLLEAEQHFSAASLPLVVLLLQWTKGIFFSECHFCF